jgi:hypothetical protein
MNFKVQHYEHKSHFDYQVEYIDKEHETQIVRNPGKFFSKFGKLVPDHCLVTRIEGDV